MNLWFKCHLLKHQAKHQGLVSLDTQQNPDLSSWTGFRVENIYFWYCIKAMDLLRTVCLKEKGFGCRMFCLRVEWFLFLFTNNPKFEAVNLYFLSFSHASESACAVVFCLISFSLSLSTVRCTESFSSSSLISFGCWNFGTLTTGNCGKLDQIGLGRLESIRGTEFISQTARKLASVKFNC